MSARRRLLRWGSWFAVVNAALLGIVGLRYLWYYSALRPSVVAWVYAVLACAGQFTAFGYLLFLLLVPLILLVPRPRVILPLGVLLASAVLSFLVLDTLVFAEHRYHLDVLTFVMFFIGRLFEAVGVVRCRDKTIPYCTPRTAKLGP